MFALLILTIAFFASASALAILVNSPIARFFGDAPNHRKVHQTIVPRLGGLGMIAGFMAVFLLRIFVPGEIWPVSGNHFSGALIFIAVFLAGAGTLDDIHTLDFKPKFLLQFILASGIVILLGHHFGTLSLFGYRFELGTLGPIATIFWIVGVMNAFNIIDGIDGLAGGVAICGFSVVAYLAHSSGASYLFHMSLLFIGLALGFLRFNFSRKHKVFLGDSGSQFLGAVLALMSVDVQRLSDARFNLFIPFLIVGYPLFDISVAMVRRYLKGSSRGISGRFVRMFAADNEHIHHKLVYLGLSHVQSTFLLLMVAGSISASAIVLPRLGVAGRVGVLAYLAFALFLILNRLGYIGLKPWVTLPRFKALPFKIVGVIEPDEVFFHSLKSFKQDKYDFLKLPSKVTKFMEDDLLAVTLYNASSEKFEEQWSTALRASEYHDCPAIVIAETQDIERLKAGNPGGFKAIHFMEKPIRVPDLIRELDKISRGTPKLKVRPREGKFSLAALAMRNDVGS